MIYIQTNGYLLPTLLAAHRPSARPVSAPANDIFTDLEIEPEEYIQTKKGLTRFMKILGQKDTSTEDLALEGETISWLTSRELGYQIMADRDMFGVFQEDFQNFLTYEQAQRQIAEIPDAPDISEKEIRAMVARTHFWLAKVALILASDLGNPVSRLFLNLKFKGTEQFVFGLDEAIPDKAIFSNEEKLRILMAIYKNLINNDKLNSERVKDPRLEAECLLAQHELRSLDPKLLPAADLAAVEAKLDKVIYDNRLGVKGKDKELPEYISKRIADQGYSKKLRGPDWRGDKMRLKESARYLAEAKQLKARLILLKTNYNQADFGQKMLEARKLLEDAQKLAGDYAGDPAPINAALRSLGKRLHLDLRINPDHYSTTSDALNLLSLEHMKAEIDYKLGLFYLPSQPELGKTKLAAAARSQQKINRMLSAIQAKYLLKKENHKRDACPDLTGNRSDAACWASNTYLFRNTQLGAGKMLLADIYLARPDNQRQNTEQAVALLQEVLDSIAPGQDLSVHQARGLDTVRLRLKLTNALLRLRPSDPQGERDKIARARRALTPLLTNNSPYAQRLAGSIQLAHAKLLLAEYNLAETDEGKARKALKLLDDIITRARPHGETGPTPPNLPPGQLPNHGAVEDYELSSAYQLRAEIYYNVFDDQEKAAADYQAALDVNAQPNYFAGLGLADMDNWRGLYPRADENYVRLIDPLVPSNVRLRAELGRAEAALRAKTLQQGADTAREAATVIAKASEILKNSDETYLIERALESIIEAIIASEKESKSFAAGDPRLPKLAEFRDSFLNGDFDLNKYLGEGTALGRVGLKEKDRMDLLLTLADGFLFTNNYDEAQKDEAQKLLERVDRQGKGKKLLAAYPALKAHYLLTEAELHLRQNDEKFPVIQQLRDAGRILFSLQGRKRDSYLCARVVQSLVDAYIDATEFENALALIFTAQGGKAAAELDQLKTGVLDADLCRTAVRQAEEIVQGADLRAIYKSKRLEPKWARLNLDLQIKLAELLVWTKNFSEAAALVKISLRPAQNKLNKLQQAKLLLVQGNIAARSNDDELVQSLWLQENIAEELKDEFKLAKYFYLAAQDKLNDLPEKKETIMVRAELLYNLGNIHRYGPSIKNFDTARAYYKDAEKAAKKIEGNYKLRNYYLGGIKLGLTKISEEEDENKLATWDKLQKAKEIIDPALAAGKLLKEPELPAELDATYAKLAPYALASVKVSGDTFRGGDNRTESQLKIEGEVPLTRHLHLLVNEQIDAADGTLLYSTYAGVKGLLGAATLSGQLKLSTGGDGQSMLYYRRPELMLDFSIWRKSMTAGLAVKLNRLGQDTDLADPLNSVYGSLAYNVNAFGLDQLQLICKLNYFHYFYFGDPQPRFSSSLGVDKVWNVSNWFQLQASAGWLMYSSQQGGGDRKWTEWKADGGEGKIGLRMSLGRHINLEAAGSYQYTPEYPIWLFTLGITGTR
ncbi:MAG: hypothetical protein JW873_06405 [Candidatus Saganbacteria bacterium]|nr:hypothetical protein [Candidatus Saganbacteria bacterium]